MLLPGRPTTNWSNAWPDGFAVTDEGESFLMFRNQERSDQETLAITVVQNWYAEFARED